MTVVAAGHAQQATVRDVHGDVHLTRYEAAPAPAEPVTAGLPPAPRTFLGRDRELQAILDAAGRDERVVAIHAIDGMAGVGKTTLATRAAHELAGRFPDGRYFVELHAHTPGHTPADPTEVLAGLLSGLGLDPHRIPHTFTGRRDMWRHHTAGKKALVVLDDAADRRQVEPLLPSGAGCLTLITSRHRLRLPDMQPLPVKVLPNVAAVNLFLTLARCDTRHPDEHAAAGRIAALCGFLPLAIGPIAGHIAHHPTWTSADIAEYAEQMAEAVDRLTALDLPGDLGVRAAFDLSYEALPPQRQLVFRRLGLHPGRDLEPHAVAALAGIDLATARAELEALYTDHLLDETARGRYRLHDLLRDYARSLNVADPATDMTRAMQRLLDHYSQHTDTPTPVWARAERDNLLACVDHAADRDPARMVALTSSLEPLLFQDGPWPLAARLHRRGADVAQRLGDRPGEANALSNLARVLWVTDDYAGAAGLHQQALVLFRAIGDRVGEANALGALGDVRLVTGEYAAAGELFRQALTVFLETGDRLGEANALNALGRVYRVTGANAAAAEVLTRALVVYREIGDRLGEAGALHTFGEIRLVTGEHAAATELLQQALTLSREVGDRLGEANVLHTFGDVRSATGDPTAAEMFQQALTIHREIGDRLGAANALAALGDVRLAAGDLDAATELLRQARTLFTEIGNRLGEANVLHTLGRAQRIAGDATAAELLRQALNIFREMGDRLGEADTLAVLGDVGPDPGTPRRTPVRVIHWIRRFRLT
ncbi:tetratricopeptide repeat protein [Nocardia sp. BMG111209]|uniref:ATP-binding protein n=1 Tax=Nocardia sp. BMG111209 TaxID=1160137 RepID=UPI00038166B4|nr:tetratricopeptide repeat protein [Nocardia sp. BMG111209]